ncbi:MAG TPA: GNAT family protein [Acidobacteriaceae bacterium]
MGRWDEVVLKGRALRLETLGMQHADGLVAASAIDPSLYRWSAVPVGREAVENYIATATELREAGKALAFAAVREPDGLVIGAARFFDIEQWAWPAAHRQHARANPDVCEIGYTWFSAPSIRTAANTETKLLMLTHAFEAWGMLRVCFHTDARNDRSAAALARIGARFEGILRTHRLAVDCAVRDSKRYSIVADEWPEVKKNLLAKLDRG